ARLSAAVLRQPVQAFVFAGRAEGRLREPVPARRLAHAERRPGGVVVAMAGRKKANALNTETPRKHRGIAVRLLGVSSVSRCLGGFPSSAAAPPAAPGGRSRTPGLPARSSGAPP